MSKDLLVFSGRSNPKFTKNITQQMGVELGRLDVVKFSDGELSVEIGDNVRGRDCFIVQSTCRPGNDHLMELLIIIDALKRASASRITAVIPYFGYSRQDRKTKSRVPITAKLVADLITAAGAHRVLTLDLHAAQIMGFFNIPVDNLNFLPVVIPYLKASCNGDDVCIISPDAGGVERAREFASRFGNVDIAVIDKRRSVPNKVSEMRVVGDVEGKSCIILDDIIDTGGTLVKACETVLSQGATKVSACCVHGVLSGMAVERVEQSLISELIITDSIPFNVTSDIKKITVLSVASLFAQAIGCIHNEDSISSLFQ